MDRELIVQALESACGNKNLKFQVIIQNAKLHIYINYKTESHPDPDFLVDRASCALAILPLDQFKGAWLYSRKRGETETDWQTYLEFPLETFADTMDTVGATQDIVEPQDPQFDSWEFSEESSRSDNSFDDGNIIEQAALEESSIDTFAQQAIYEDEATEDLNQFDLEDLEEDSSGNTDLLTNTGMIHKAALQEAEINTFAQRLVENKVESDSELNLPPSSAIGKSAAKREGLTFIQYCFVVNKKMLTEDILPPDKETIRLVKVFHHLSDNNKQRILPLLENYFESAKIPDLQQLPVSIQKWLQQITELTLEQRQIAEIWLSRYCFAPDTTLEEFKIANEKSAAAATAKKPQHRNSEYAFTSASSNRDSTAESDELGNKSKFPPIIQNNILPLAWTVVTLMLIVLGIVTSNSQVASQANPNLCNTSVATEYCRLAVNLVGEKELQKIEPTTFALTEITATEAIRGCERYANVKANMTNIDPSKTPAISSHGETILPHIYVVEATQRRVKNLEQVRVGCVYTTGKGERSPQLVKADLIPQAWPQQQYRSQTTSQANISFGIFTQAINLGLYTIFTAIGIAIASRLNLGIEIAKVNTIYIVAVVVALVQITAGINFWAGIILPAITMIVLSLVIKDFQLNKNFGYPLVAAGIFIIVATQFLLYGLFQLVINGLV